MWSSGLNKTQISAVIGVDIIAVIGADISAVIGADMSSLGGDVNSSFNPAACGNLTEEYIKVGKLCVKTK